MYTIFWYTLDQVTNYLNKHNNVWIIVINNYYYQGIKKKNIYIYIIALTVL